MYDNHPAPMYYFCNTFTFIILLLFISYSHFPNKKVSVSVSTTFTSVSLVKVSEGFSLFLSSSIVVISRLAFLSTTISTYDAFFINQLLLKFLGWRLIDSWLASISTDKFSGMIRVNCLGRKCSKLLFTMTYKVLPIFSTDK